MNPAQNTLERPYIQRNIDATREAMGLEQAWPDLRYPASTKLTAPQLSANSDTLANVRLWDPTQTQPTYDKLQDIRYLLPVQHPGRGPVQGERIRRRRPWSGVREVNDADLPSTSWVNTTCSTPTATA